MAIRIWSGVTIGPTGRKILALLEYYPKKSEIYITSGYRNTSDHHGGLYWNGSPTAALDIGFGGTAYPARGRDVAKWLYDNLWDCFVELIHTTPFSTDNGFYVKNGTKVGPSYYGATTNAQHANHVHVAGSSASLDKALARAKARFGNVTNPTPAPAPATDTKQRLAGVPYKTAKTIGPVRTRTRLIVLHATDNTASAADEAQYNSTRTDGIGAHMFVDAKSAYQCAPLDRVMYTAYPTANSMSIHVEMCGRSGAISTATWQNTAKYVARICKLWNIPIVHLTAADLLAGKSGIPGHGDVTKAWHTGPDAGASHTDPGTFPWSSFIAAVKAAAYPPSPAPEPTREDSLMLIKEVDKPEVYLSDGFVYRHILDPSALAALQTVLKAQGQSTTVIVVPAGSIAAGVFGKPVAAAPAVDVAALAAALAKLLPTQACVCDCDCANCALTTADIAAAFRHVLDNTKLGPLA